MTQAIPNSGNLEIQLRDVALHEAVVHSLGNDTAQEVVKKALVFLNFLKTGESNE